jgi:hypothetical protein
LQERLDIEAELTPGARGQFDVFVAGELVASAQQVGFLRRLFGGGVPDPDEVFAAIERRAVESSG